MADILIDNQSAPSTPASGKSVLWLDSTTKKFVQTDDSGARHGAISKAFSTAAQGAGFASDTYITNSGILIPSYGMEAGQLYRWWVSMEKTGAGTAAPILTIRLGSAQTTSDTARNTITGTAASATASGGHMIASCLVRTVSASGVLVGTLGFTNSLFGGGQQNVSSTFDNTAVAGQFLGLSFNAGASASYTIQAVYSELVS